MKNHVVIVEYYSKKHGYEKMFEREYDKKMRGEQYECIERSEEAPWIVFGEELTKADWVARHTHMTYKEAEALYGKYQP